jgi:regulator of sirC expression with transglutaminase-like and TPR domain
VSKLLCFFCLILVFTCKLVAREATPAKARALYSSLDPNSISEYLAFHQLYPNTNEGKRALNDAWQLLNKKGRIQRTNFSYLPDIHSTIEALVALINKEPNEEAPQLTADELSLVENLCNHLGNRRLKGFRANSEREVTALNPPEIDLARGLFLSQLGESEEALNKMRCYEAVIDLMALQILTKLPSNATYEQTIRAINHFVFTEMGFRFPPHSLYAKDIDVYTFLPSVLDSRRGVCLGVSILYLCLAQRLDLPLEMITPPGHIYIRYHQGNTIINIETTARGIHIDSEEYLSIDTRKLQQRNLKEVIGFAHVNQASVYLQQADYDKSLASYLKALPYLPEDHLLKELMGFNYIFVGNDEKGKQLLNEIRNDLPDFAVSKDSMVEDYLLGKTDAEAVKAIFMHVDETRESILEKREALTNAVNKYPEFRAGLSSLATTWLQLHREGEALEVLEKQHAIDSTDPTTNYYMAVLYAERMNYQKAWEHLAQTEKIAFEREHHPKALKDLRKQLAHLSPE